MKRTVLIALGIVVALPVLLVGMLAIRFRPKAEREEQTDVTREIVKLTRVRDSLRAIVAEAALTSDLLDRRPDGDIVIALPTQFVDNVVRGVVTGWFHDVDLKLPQIRLHKTGDVRARLGFFGKRHVGTYALDVTLNDVQGRLQPGVPELAFGGDVIGLQVPVRVANGTGVAHVKAAWESKGFAGPVCGDMTVERNVTGQVRARTYLARGRILLSSVNGSVLADPDFPGLAIRLFIDPAASSVAALDSALATRTGLCGYAVSRSKASERIQELVARGFNVKIPQRFFRRITLPVSVETAVPVAGRQLALTVTPSGVSVTPSTVWIAANVALTRRTDPVRAVGDAARDTARVGVTDSSPATRDGRARRN
ncbi:MAG: hypothetical protein H7305_06605 [Gemmatimonadaceae bacterium]|nr:hypothetical protein [Gemmatimonadaceae bacterium]